MKTSDILSRQDDIGKTKYYHEILVRGADFEAARKKVLGFFEKYQLVRYSYISINKDLSVAASSKDFRDRLHNAVMKNRKIVQELLDELKAEGIIDMDDMSALPQGYKSKMLHVITHFLDGFFGIDTWFYNLEEDSHWVSDKLLEQLQGNTEHYWILGMEARI